MFVPAVVSVVVVVVVVVVVDVVVAVSFVVSCFHPLVHVPFQLHNNEYNT